MISRQATPLRQVQDLIDVLEVETRPPFPVDHDESAKPTPGIWSPGHQLVAHGHGDTLLCPACGTSVATMLRAMPSGFVADGEPRETWWVIPVESDGRCMDCVWMELPGSERMRHISIALGAYQLQLELSAQDLVEIRELAA